MADFEAAYYRLHPGRKRQNRDHYSNPPRGDRITFIPSSVRGQRANVISSVLGPTSTVTIVYHFIIILLLHRLLLILLLLLSRHFWLAVK